jgi:hypothetical protein
MKKKQSWWEEVLKAVGYILGSFFIGATFLIAVEAIGSTLADKNISLWEWYTFSTLTGGFLWWLWQTLVPENKDDN